MVSMLKELLEHISHACRVSHDQPIILGVSGGPDSIFMLDVLHRAGYPLILAHLDHQLRPESLHEADYVKQIACQLNIPMVVESLDVGAYARTYKLSIEQAAREVRYEFLFRQANASGAQAVAVGHTADDQIETVLLHLLRGTGLAGLSGMKYRRLPNPWSQSIPLIRPILGIWRHQILEYLADKPYQPQQDVSNWDKTYMRNRIRHELIPFLESYNQQLRQNIFQMTNILNEDEQVLQKIARKAWDNCLLNQGKGYLQFDAGVLLREPLAIQRRLVREAFVVLLNDLTDIEFQHIDQVIQFIANPPRSSSSQLVAGLKISYEGDSIFIFDQRAELPVNQWPQLPGTGDRNLPIPGEATLNGQWIFHSRLFDLTPETLEIALSNQDKHIAWLDYDQIQLPLIMRCRQPGDRFRPLGMSGKSQKLSDYLINQKMTHRARNHWPLIASENEIIWIPGYSIAHSTQLTPHTKRVLFLQMERMIIETLG